MKTQNYGLCFKRRSKKSRKLPVSYTTKPIGGSSDTGWSNDKNDRKSVTGELLKYRGILVGSLSKKPDAVALSKDDAEYRVMTEVIQRTVYEKKLATSFNKKRAGIEI